MKCTHCGADLPDGSTVCFECGATQQASAQTNAQPPHFTPTPMTNQNTQAPFNATQAPQTKKCQNCGADLPASATVCFQCGAPQNVASPNYGTPVMQNAATGTSKSKILAALLAFFLGCYGIDQFYLGFTKNAIIRIIVTIVTCSVGGVIWGIIDCIRITTGAIKVDAHGNPIL